jgi:signal transduction histidine kinase/CheY-like chemotaxis protein
LSELTAELGSPLGSAVENSAPLDLGPRPFDVRARQLESLCRRATRPPLVAAVGALLVGYTAWGYAAPWLIASWLICVCAIAFAHRAFSHHILRHPPADPLPALHIQLLLMFASGVVIGCASLLLFSHLPLERQALLTMTLMFWIGAIASATAAYARGFYVHAIPILLPLALLWASAGSVDDVALGALIAMFGLVLGRVARDSDRAARLSLEIHRDHERLIERLAHERHQAGLARQAAQNADHAKSRFLAAASHDLRQPLHTLSLYSAAMQLRRLDGDMVQISGNIDQAVASLSALVDSLLDISRLDAGAIRPQPQRIHLKPFLAQIAADMEPAARKRGLELQVSTSDTQVDSDPALLERLVRSFLDNAIKHTPQGSVALCAELDDGDVRIAVRDTGPGIAPEERHRIFEEFYQIGNPERDRAQGLGLGLAIARRLATLLHVRIELESSMGQGSTFAVRMAPARSRPPEPAAVNSASTERSLTGVAILVIDDEPAVRASMRTLLESWGCRVLACGGLDEAKAALAEERFEPQIIVSDLRLRHHENGIETVRALQSIVGPVPALVLTGDIASERLRQVHASGLPMLHKPVSAARLKEALVALLTDQASRSNQLGPKDAEGAS